jgi:uncharacterized protein YfaS (alpha-2-macroglobulin family)
MRRRWLLSPFSLTGRTVRVTSIICLCLAAFLVKLFKESRSNEESFAPRLQENVHQTLPWLAQLTTHDKGPAHLDSKLADNITIWKMSANGSKEKGEVGTTETKIRAFQPSFAELDPPRVFTEGDRLSLPVVLCNYPNHKQTVDRELKTGNCFKLVADGNSLLTMAASLKLIVKSSSFKT